ncbi:MAG: ABC transporter ATP-binding protein [Bacteroidetes bacterium]|nr:ABC transporter ATP-binding protein [Bacteroidota bacterium]
MNPSTVIHVEQLSKQYRLGQVGRKTLHDDVNRLMHRLIGKSDPYLKIGEENDRTFKGNSEYVWALRDINFSVQHGEILGIIGRNGAGKSTLLKILSKVTSPTLGNIKIKGSIAALLEVGTGFHPELSGRDNIFLNGAILGMTKKEIRRKFDEIVSFAGVERYIDTPVKRYSSGMYVRLAFSVAAHLEPDILIVDEVLAVGDAEFQKKCLGKMKDVSEKEGRTVLFVSHNMPAILNLCSHVMILENGKKTFNGLPENGISTYLHSKKEEPETPLHNRTDRKGNGLLRCTDIRFFNDKLLPVASVKSGDDVMIQVHYTLKDKPLRNVYFRIQILDANEQILFTINNGHSGSAFPLLAQDGFVTCTLYKIPLFGGDYLISTLIYSEEAGTFDQVEFAKKLTVVDGDYFGTGKIPVIRKGVLTNYSWSQ